VTNDISVNGGRGIGMSRTTIKKLRWLLIGLICTAAVRADIPTSSVPGIVLSQEERKDPPMRLFWAQVDLTAPGISVRVSPGGDDPDGPGPYQTVLMTPSEIVKRDGFDLAVNGDFFTVKKPVEGKPIEQQPGAAGPNRWGAALGPAVTDGKVWSVSKTKRPCLAIAKEGTAKIVEIDSPGGGIWEVVSGNVFLVKDGKAVAHQNKDRHPRTVVGVNEKGTKLTLLVVDGRQAGVSIGMTYEDLSKEMIRLGCYDAINLDGGGSSAMVARDLASGKMVTCNKPSEGKERPVATVLGVKVAK